jgi:hypothetical protein
MSTVYTNDLRVRNAKNLFDSVSDNNDSSYLFVGRTKPWDNDSVPPVPKNNLKEYNEVHDEMLSLKRILPGEVSFMIKRYNFISGTIYDNYRHDYSTDLRSFNGASNLFDAIWCVLSSNRVVYACLDNNGNQPSTVEPLVDRIEPFVTSDGYQWIKLYKLTSTEYSDKMTKNYLPVSDNEQVVENEGSLYTIIIDNPGNLFTSSPDGSDQNVRFYYTKVSGDGEDATARIEVQLGKVSNIQIIDFGYGYTRGEIRMEYGYVYGSYNDLLNERNSLNPIGDGSFRSTVIISPKGGWGYDLVEQLGATRVGFMSRLEFDKNEFNSEVSYRQVGILKSPEVTNPSLTLTSTYGIKLSDSISVYEVDETISQVNDENETAYGRVVDFDPVTSVLRYIQNPADHSDENGNLNRFSGLNNVSAGSKKTTVDPFTGTADGTEFLMGHSQPGMLKNTGEILYLNNITPVQRSKTQKEKINIIISY